MGMRSSNASVSQSETTCKASFSSSLRSDPPAMEAYRVSCAVNTPRDNCEELLLPVG